MTNLRHDYPELVGLAPVEREAANGQVAHYLNPNWHYQDSSSHANVEGFLGRQRARAEAAKKNDGR